MAFDLTRHDVQITHRGPFATGWAPAGQMYRPTLSKFIRNELAEKHGGFQFNDEEMSNLVHDTNMNRVAAYGLTHTNAPEAILWCLPASWNELMAVRRIREANGALPALETFQALAVDVLLRTGDEKFILNQRSRPKPGDQQALSSHQGMIGASASGYANFEADTKNLLENSAITEAWEETGMQGVLMTRKLLGCCVHPMKNPIWCNAAYYAETPLSSEEVIAMEAKDSWEGRTFTCTAEEVCYLMATAKMHPPAAAAIELAFEYLGIKAD